MVEVAEARLGREQDQTAPGLYAPALELRPAGMPHDLDLIQVIHAGAAEGAIGDWEASRLDNVRVHPQARAKAQDRAGVLRDVRLIERDPHGTRVSCPDGEVCNWLLR